MTTVTPNDHANVDATPLSEEDDPWDAESRAQEDYTDSLGSFAFTLDAGELWVLMASWYDEDPLPDAWGTVWQSEPAEVFVRGCAEVELILITDIGPLRRSRERISRRVRSEIAL